MSQQRIRFISYTSINMARPKEKEVVMTKQGKRTYRIDKNGKKLT